LKKPIKIFHRPLAVPSLCWIRFVLIICDTDNDFAAVSVGKSDGNFL